MMLVLGHDRLSRLAARLLNSVVQQVLCSAFFMV
jgi:hypothetical protein